MIRTSFIILLLLLSASAESQIKTIHVFVALCDNQNQGIVPVPESLGNGQDPKNNLYWGAMFGVKSFFRYKSEDWEYLGVQAQKNPKILERILFKHKSKEVYLIADAYDGLHIRTAVEDFLLAANHQKGSSTEYNGKGLNLGGTADLVAFVGHDGLMDFDVDLNYLIKEKKSKSTIVLACASRDYFGPQLQKAGATPLLGTTNLMAPEAYTLEAALAGWLKGETGAQIHERAAQAYNRYQKCGIKGARNLFYTD